MRVVARPYAIASRERCGEKVKGAPQRSNDSPHIGVDNWWKRLFLARYPALATRLRIRIYPSYLDRSLVPCVEPSRGDAELGFAPIFCPKASIRSSRTGFDPWLVWYPTGNGAGGLAASSSHA